MNAATISAATILSTTAIIEALRAAAQAEAEAISAATILSTTAIIEALRAAAQAEAEAIAADPSLACDFVDEDGEPDDRLWNLPGAADGRRITGEAGMQWEFTTWTQALEAAEDGQLGGVDLFPVTATVQELIARAEEGEGCDRAFYALAPLLALDLAPVDVMALRSACLVLVARKVGTRDRRSALREVADVCDTFEPDPSRHGTVGDFSAAMHVWEAAARAWPRSGWAAGLAALQADEAERSASLASVRAELL